MPRRAAKQAAAMQAAMPMPWTEGATRSAPSRLRLLSYLAGLVLVGLLVAWWVRHQQMSPLRLFVLGGLVVVLLVWAGRHRRNGGLLVVKGIEWALVASLAVTLLGGTAPHAAKPAPHGPHGKTAKQTTARENPSPATLGKSAAAACRKIQPCRDLLGWYEQRLGDQAAKGGKPAPKPAGKPAGKATG